MRARLMLSLLVILPACGGGSDDAGLGPRGPVALESFPREFAASWCRTYATCRVIGDRDNSYNRWLFGASIAACTDYLAAELDDPQEDVAAARAGKVRYDPVAARRCMDGKEALCLRDDSLIAGCDEIFDGLVELGGACDSTKQCAGDAFCELGDTCGVCVAKKPIGSSCTYTGCSVEDGPADCIEELCRAVTTVSVGEGAFCDTFGLDPGDPTPVCGPGTYCREGDFELNEDTLCLAYDPIGGPCQWQGNCAELGRCVGQDDEGRGTCQRVTIHSDAGASCDELNVCNPLARLECAAGHCVSLGDGTEGSRCNASDSGFVGCLAAFTCDSETRRCVPREPECHTANDCGDSVPCVDEHCQYPERAICEP